MSLITTFYRRATAWIRSTGPLFLVVATGVGCADSDISPQSVNDSSVRPNDVPAQSGLSPELARIFHLIQNGQPDRARLHLQRHILENPDDGQALFLFGLSFHVQHRYNQAQVHFRSARDMVPEYPPLHYFYGWCLYYLGELDEAKVSFEAHLRLQPDEADSLFALGLIALDQNRLDDAHKFFARTITRYTDDVQNTEALGRAHGKLGQTYARVGGTENLQLARQHLTIGTELYPDDHESLYQLYRVLLSLGEQDAADDARRRHEAARLRANLPGQPAP